MQSTEQFIGATQPHNGRPTWIWSTERAGRDEFSRGISDAIEHCVMRLAPRPGERILDLATGTGWTSRAVARHGASVIGVDTDPDLLHIARTKAASAERLLIHYRAAEPDDLPFATGEFDAVVSTFGVMFTSDPETTAEELARVCRKGGRIALTTWLPGSTLSQVFEVMRRYMPPASTPEPQSPFDWGRPERIHELLGHAFKLRFEKGVSFYREPSGEAAWNTFSRSHGPTRSLASSLDSRQRVALRREVTAFHAGFTTELGICVPREYLLTVGLRV